MVLDPEKKKQAVQYLNKEFDTKFKSYLLGMRDAKDLLGIMGRKSAFENGQPPKYWVTPIHHGIGTAIRNQLRKGGFGEKEFGIDNIDDYYEDILNDLLNQFIKEDK